MKLSPLNRLEMVREFRHRYPTGHVIRLLFAGCSIEVRCNAAKLIADLEQYFRPFVVRDEEKAMIRITVHEAPEPHFRETFVIKEPDPGKTRIKEEYLDLADGRVVRKRLTGMVFLFGGEDHLAVGPCCANPNQIVNFINSRFIAWKLHQGYLLGHAAGVTVAGQGLAFAGFSGMGKSTLALHLMSSGAHFVSNDRLLVKKETDQTTMFGVAKLPRINPGTALHNEDLQRVIPLHERRRFAALPVEELWELEHKYDVFISEAFGADRFALSAPMRGLVILNWRRNKGKAVVQRVDLAARQDLLPAFMKSTGLFFLPEEAEGVLDHSPANYLAMLSDITVLEISGGVDFAAATGACLEFFGQQ
ncbi:MAG: HprK-related kinase B [Thermodesulfobacteriota bacterium]